MVLVVPQTAIGGQPEESPNPSLKLCVGSSIVRHIDEYKIEALPAQSGGAAALGNSIFLGFKFPGYKLTGCPILKSL